MTETLQRGGFEERLLLMLKDAVEEASASDQGTPTGNAKRPSRRRARFVLLATALTALTGAGLLAGSAIGGRQVVVVGGFEALRDPGAVERQLRDAGIDATIVEVPLPSTRDPEGYWQGRWWWITVDRPADLTQEEFDRLYEQVGVLSRPNIDSTDVEDTRLLELPKMPGHITLFVGREVPAGQSTVFEYDRINELSPVGAFYCLGIDPNDPETLGAALESRGYRVMWTLESENHGTGVAAPPADTVATWAWLQSPDLVDIRLAPSGRGAAKYQSAEGTFPLGETPPWAPPCA